jgi:putative transposase
VAHAAEGFFPPWKTVFHYFRRWRLDGIWERMNRAVRRPLRKRLGRDPEPSAGTSWTANR